ncbi:MAG: DUF4384 domain-containing protein [Nitrospirales bacterium]|nr:DUF4384 domain-containing protein [Nitrospira sp.]MDR4501527.1 DUF4384 domain-containing protein [Nitrospirales bacterium]
MLKHVTTFIVLLIFLTSCATQPMGGSSLSDNPCQPNTQSFGSSFMQSQFASSLMKFGGNLLATAANNYSQKYTGKLEKFLTKLVTPKKKRKRNQDDDQFTQDQVFTDDQQDFQGTSDSDQGVFDQDQGVVDDGQEFVEEGGDPNEAFQDQGSGDEQGFVDVEFQEQQDGEFDQEVSAQFVEEPVSRGISGRFPVGQPEQDPCAQFQDQQGGDQTYAGQQDGYQEDGQQYAYDEAQSQQGYEDQGYDESTQDGVDDQGQGYDQGGSGEAIGLDVALVRKTMRNGAPVILPVQDGDVLRDGRGNPQAGDKFRVMFRPNSTAYVYVIAVDGSGWAQGIFPSPTSPFANPVKAGEQYVIPESSHWFSLDQFKGVETLFFIASNGPRQDIEDIFKSIMGRERPASATPQQVTQAAIIPNGYGGAHPSQTPFDITLASGGQHEIVPTSFLAKTAGEDLRITRWFRHQ